MRWDLFCHVVDNFGDVGVCWRLARDLAQRGDAVRLWIDDARALSWMAPEGCPGVEVGPWDEAARATPGEAVIEAFGCNPPEAFVGAMVRCHPAPVWINLEYLSAEDYVERSHALPSPTPSGLIKYFFFPGFTERTGGLLREPGLAAQRAGFDRTAWLAQQGWAPRATERVVSVFCYENPALARWMEVLALRPALVLVTPGVPARQLGQLSLPASVRTIELPWLCQDDYDRLLWSCDLNLVRGEDSFVRAQWAGMPFLWQIYPQHDGVHRAKLEAFLDRYLDGAPDHVAADVRAAQRNWNGFDDAPPCLPELDAWQTHHQRWIARLLQQRDLTSQLRAFCERRIASDC